ncbi:outer membrane assembly lipoprotein YfiO [Prevotella dentalis DSM 3688]|uniref:Outer membrane assembly lipoprotein YfiO n=1 Tax=Prevotella dentalis (strain ATCC 49559 / DSM 3688 / JCM 13448 / NCTC 12043 / ES 2772) TaxID=908937 RepID=L0JDD6_PREDD|nr:outer membrane assembly lipoprotein YfiO [Prevotella dentalis DSM 3688]
MQIKEICVILHVKRQDMKKTVTVALSALLLCTSCAKEFNQVYKSQDWRYKYEYAKECFAQGKYTRATTLLQELIVQEKGTPDAEESLYMLAMAEYCSRDYETAAEAFKRYVKTYPRGVYAEQASYYVGQSLYMSTPEPRLDQSETVRAISAFQEYLDIYPDARMKELAQQRLFALQDKLVEKELLSARLYYDLGSYFGNCFSGGNNYEACIVTAQNALKDYPYTSKREDFAVLIMKSKYELAQQSIEARKLERFQDAEDECYGFINEYPDSKERKHAEEYIEKCKKVTSTAQE